MWVSQAVLALKGGICQMYSLLQEILSVLIKLPHKQLTNSKHGATLSSPAH